MQTLPLVIIAKHLTVRKYGYLVRYMSHLLPDYHTLISVNEQTVGLHLDVIFKILLVAHQSLHGRLSLSQPHPQTIDGGADLTDLAHQAVLHRIATELHVRTDGALVQSGMSDLQWCLFVYDGHSEVAYVILH